MGKRDTTVILLARKITREESLPFPAKRPRQISSAYPTLCIETTKTSVSLSHSEKIPPQTRSPRVCIHEDLGLRDKGKKKQNSRASRPLAVQSFSRLVRNEVYDQSSKSRRREETAWFAAGRGDDARASRRRLFQPGNLIQGKGVASLSLFVVSRAVNKAVYLKTIRASRERDVTGASLLPFSAEQFRSPRCDRRRLSENRASAIFVNSNGREQIETTRMRWILKLSQVPATS